MTLTVNASKRDMPEGTTVAALVGELGLSRQACAVEVNRVLVPKQRHDGHVLGDGDVIEVVTLVGGG